MLFNKRYSIVLRAISVLLIHAFFLSNVAWAVPITSNPKYSLARWTANEDYQVKREIFATMYRESGLVWGIKPGTRHDRTLKRLRARGFLLGSGRYAVPEILKIVANPENDLLLIRICSHEDSELLMQKEEQRMLRAKDPRRTRYYRLREQILNNKGMLKAYYEQLPKREKDSISQIPGTQSLLAALLSATIKRFNLKNKRNRTKEEQARSILFNDLIACAFELLFIIDEYLVYPSTELSVEEREFIKLMRPILEAKDSRGRYKNFSQVFFDIEKRTKLVRGLQEDKDERFYRVASASSNGSDTHAEQTSYGAQENWKRMLIDSIRSGFDTGVRNIFPAVSKKFMEYSLKQDAMTIFDLEDSVTSNRKAEARYSLIRTFENPDFLTSLDSSKKSLWVRINDVRSRYIARDLLEVISHPEIGGRIDGILLPKVETAEDVKIVQSILKMIQRRRAAEGCKGWHRGKLRIQATIESARSVQNISEIAEQPSVVSLISGLVDYKYSMGAWDQHHQFPDSLFEKSEIIRAAKAYGLIPIDSITSSLSYDKSLEESRKAIAMGFCAKGSVYPAHIKAAYDAGNEVNGWPKYTLEIKDYDSDKRVEAYSWEELVRKAKANEPLLVEASRTDSYNQKNTIQGVVWKVDADWNDFDAARTADVDTIHLVIGSHSDFAKAKILAQILRKNPHVQEFALDITLPEKLSDEQRLLMELWDNFECFDALVLRGEMLNSETVRRISEFCDEQERNKAPPAEHPVWLKIVVSSDVQYDQLYEIIQQNPRVNAVINNYSPIYGFVESTDRFFTSQDTQSQLAIKMGKILNTAQAAHVSAIQELTSHEAIAREVLVAAKNGYRGFVITNLCDVMETKKALQPSETLIAEALTVVKGIHLAEGQYIVSTGDETIEDRAEISHGVYEKHPEEIVGAIQITAREFFDEPNHAPEQVLADKATQLMMANVLNRARELHRKHHRTGDGFLRLSQLRDIEVYANPKFSKEDWGIDFTVYEPIWDDAGADTFHKIRNRRTGKVYRMAVDGTYPIPPSHLSGIEDDAHVSRTSPAANTESVHQAFNMLDKEVVEEVPQLNTEVSRLHGTSQKLMNVTKFRFCVPMNILRNAADITLALNSTELLKQKPQGAENVEFELVVTGVKDEDIKIIESLNRDDIKKALNLPSKFTVSMITEAQLETQINGNRLYTGYDIKNPRDRALIVKGFYTGLEDGAYMAIATDALDSAEQADALKEELEGERLKAELKRENVSVLVLVKPQAGRSMYSLSKIINEWLKAINRGNLSSISKILPIPTPLTPELEKAIKEAWAVLIAA